MAGTYNIAANLINILVRELNFALSIHTHRIEDLGRSRNCFVRNKKEITKLKSIISRITSEEA